jgi:hypothetical protein
MKSSGCICSFLELEEDHVVASHRFRSWLGENRLSQSSVAQPSLKGFVACPVPVLQAFGMHQLTRQQQLYQMAFQEAQAVARPSILERDLLGVWN